MLQDVKNILHFPREWVRERTAMARTLFRILENASVVKGPSPHLQHLYSSPADGAACDFPCFDLYQCRTTGTHYVRQTGGLLGEVVWYIENNAPNVGSASADRLHEL